MNARASGIVDPYDRGAVFQGHVHNFTDLLRYHPAQATAENSEILRICVDQPAIYGPVAGYHRISRYLFFLHVEVRAAVRPQPIELDEAPVVKKDIEPLPRQKFSLFMLAPDLIIPPTGICLPVQVAKLLQIVF